MRTVRGFAVLLVVLALCHPLSAAAWGQYGHLTVCDLAYRNLSPDARIALQKLMRSSSGGITASSR
jgi:hypothetical protein